MLIQLTKIIAFLSFGLFLMSPSCEKKTNSTTTTPTEQSETFALDPQLQVPIVDTSKDFKLPYEVLWKQVDSLNNLGLYRSAVTKVEVILRKSQVDNNAEQLVKSLMFKMRFNSELEEDDYILAIHELNQIASQSKAPLKQLIYSISADVYWGYYQQNRYQILDRTETVNFENNDIRTWDAKKIIDKAYKFYQLSLTDAAVLKSKSVTDYKTILLQGNTDDKRPTLFDFLAYKALDFFSNSETELARPAEHFTISDAFFFAPTSEFIAGVRRVIPLTEPADSMSNLLYATSVLFELSTFHENDSKPEAFLDLAIRRLKFAKSKSTLSNASELYINALEDLSKLYPKSESTAEINYLRAEFYSSKGNSNSLSPENRWMKKQAVEICNQTNALYPNSYGAQACMALKDQIEAKNFSFDTEEAYASNQPSKFIFKYKNMDQIHFRVVSIPWDNNLKNRLELEDLLKLNPVKKWETKLENFNDYQMHSIEFQLPDLKKGHYAILASYDPNFKTSNTTNAIACSNFWVSDLNYITRNNYAAGTLDIYVTDRNTGKAKSNVIITQYEQIYNYNTRKYEFLKSNTYVTDKNGMALITKTKRKNQYSYSNYLHLSYQDDSFLRTSAYYLNDPYTPKEHSSTYFFTDRSIYRPGQTIYFKGIFIDSKEKKPIIQVGVTKKIELYDANYQVITSVDLKSNEYGSISGSFKIPTGLANGNFYIQTSDGTKFLKVEEYKRPKFSVSVNPIKGTFKLGQTIDVEGVAKSYAGASIEMAKVNYRVVRNYTFPRWSFYRYWYTPSAAAAVEIAFGEIATDENGKFNIQFSALADPSVNSKYSPIYSYQVYIDVTDITGETQSTQSYVSVGTQAMQLSIGINEEVSKNKIKHINISSTNLMGNKLNAKGQIKIYQLTDNSMITRKKRWESPDLKSFSEEEYRKLFPYDMYNNLPDSLRFTRGKVVGTYSFDTEKSDSISLPLFATLKAGRYQIEAESVDSFGVNVQSIKQIVLFDEKSTAIATKDIFKVYQLDNIFQPGDTSRFLLSASLANTVVSYEIEINGQIIKHEFLELNANQKMISIPVLESYRGNFTVHFLSSKWGDFYQYDFEVIVPRTDKILDIEFETFRDKLSPGQTEEWRLKIKGPGGEKVAAELLASMYDASLDQFMGNSYYLNVFPSNNSQKYWSDIYDQTNSSASYHFDWNEYKQFPTKNYSQLNWFGFNVSSRYYYGYEGEESVLYDAVRTVSKDKAARSEKKLEVNLEENSPAMAPTSTQKNSETREDELGGGLDGDASLETTATGNSAQVQPAAIRSNFNETAFFYPQLKTDNEGNVVIQFTIPESLTKWKFIALAHSQDLKIGYTSKETVTQKELMVTPFVPRFMREGDRIFLTAKVDNLSENDLSGTVKLMLFDAKTDQPIDAEFKNLQPEKNISIKKGSSTSADWEIQVPFGTEAVKYRFIANTPKHTDGEENVLPVLSNRMLVTESMPLPSKKAGTKEFRFEKLLQSGNSTSIQNHSLTLEYTANPAWYAVQALPYMMEYPYECAEQLFSRFYSNSIASHIMKSNPRIQAVFESWKEKSPETFLSNLQKNESLKSLVLEETPWVLQAKSEQERKKRVALLFDFSKMNNDLAIALEKLNSMQASNGGWPWFKGMQENRYITQHIVAGMGHLKELGITDIHDSQKTWNMVKNAINYLDKRILEDFIEIKKYDKLYQTRQHVSEFHIHYLYARSFFNETPMNQAEKEAVSYFQKQAKTYWKNFDIFNQGMIALQANRNEDLKFAQLIMASLKERAILNDELGMYWKDNTRGYFWYQAPIETQALLIEAFDEITNDVAVVNELKVWLLKQKQTTDWKTTKATTEACYALLRSGTNLLTEDSDVEISIGRKVFNPAENGVKIEEGTGYFSKTWTGNEIKPEMGKVSVKKTRNSVSWGAMYWQYFEDLDKITPHETPLKLAKKLFLVTQTKSGPVITPVTDQTKLSPGDKVRVRIELRTDRNMEYIHLKDMRAAGFEPINVFSQYKWQDGLGYYENTKDASTNFFIDFLPKGTYVFEYDLRVSHCGNFSNGISSIQSMYAPEFTSHSEGIRVKVSK